MQWNKVLSLVSTWSKLFKVLALRGAFSYFPIAGTSVQEKVHLLDMVIRFLKVF